MSDFERGQIVVVTQGDHHVYQAKVTKVFRDEHGTTCVSVRTMDENSKPFTFRGAYRFFTGTCYGDQPTLHTLEEYAVLGQRVKGRNLLGDLTILFANSDDETITAKVAALEEFIATHFPGEKP